MELAVERARVLVVEDESIVARDIASQVKKLGYELVGIASTAEHAIAQVAQMQPHLVLMDIELDGPVDGIAAAATIRSRFNVPIVFLTAFSSDDVLARAQLSEPFGYILKPFSERELSATISLALYKHEAETALRTTARQLKALSRRVLEVQELERRRLAVELHDELGQSLTAIKINLQLGQRLKDQALADLTQENIRIVEDTLQQVRLLATNLRPSMLDDLGLAVALQWVSAQSGTRSGFAVQFHHVRDQSRLASDIETACFRIVQEALTNITRHAEAKHVRISLDRDGPDLVLSIVDDGRGFNLQEMRARAVSGSSIGVLGMQERASLIGGVLTIDSALGKGSSVTVRCPWRTPEESQ
jgi:signal transduction histidine kinase